MDLNDPVVSLLVTDDAAIQELNRTWRQQDKPTDVLSFPAFEASKLPDNPPHLGDIIISAPTAKRMAQSGEHRRRVAIELDHRPDALDWSVGDEIAFLFIHGLLHLVGYDHQTETEQSQMKAMESRLWTLMTSDAPCPGTT